jgi:hypothetical protein
MLEIQLRMPMRVRFKRRGQTRNDCATANSSRNLRIGSLASSMAPLEMLRAAMVAAAALMAAVAASVAKVAALMAATAAFMASTSRFMPFKASMRDARRRHGHDAAILFTIFPSLSFIVRYECLNQIVTNYSQVIHNSPKRVNGLF